MNMLNNKVLILLAAVFLLTGELAAQNRTRPQGPPEDVLTLPYDYEEDAYRRLKNFDSWILGDHPDKLEEQEAVKPGDEAAEAKMKEKEAERKKLDPLSVMVFRRKLGAVNAITKSRTALEDTVEATGYRPEYFNTYRKEAEKLLPLIYSLELARSTENNEQYEKKFKEYSDAAKEFRKTANRKTWRRLTSKEMKGLKARNRERRAKEWYNQQKAQNSTGEKK